MAAARDRRELRNGRPKQEFCGGHESDHDGAPTSLPIKVVSDDRLACRGGWNARGRGRGHALRRWSVS